MGQDHLGVPTKSIKDFVGFHPVVQLYYHIKILPESNSVEKENLISKNGG